MRQLELLSISHECRRPDTASARPATRPCVGRDTLLAARLLWEMGCCGSRDDSRGSSGGGGGSDGGSGYGQVGQPQPHPNLAARSGGVRPSQVGRPTIDPTTGLPIQKKKKKSKKTASGSPGDAPDMSKSCSSCGQQGTLFSKEGFSYCGMPCLKAHGSTAEFQARYADNETRRNP